MISAIIAETNISLLNRLSYHEEQHISTYNSVTSSRTISANRINNISIPEAGFTY